MSITDILNSSAGRTAIVAIAFGGGMWGGQYVTTSQLQSQLDSQRESVREMLERATYEAKQDGRLETLERIAGATANSIGDILKDIKSLTRRVDQHDSRINYLERAIP